MQNEVCMKAAELIENNFIRNAYVGSEGELCLDGSLLTAAGITLDNGRPSYVRSVEGRAYIDAVQLVLLVLPKVDVCCDNSLRGIHHYNDEHCDGGVMAAKLLREAAEVEL